MKSGMSEKALGGLSSPYTTVPSMLPPKSPVSPFVASKLPERPSCLYAKQVRNRWEEVSGYSYSIVCSCNNLQQCCCRTCQFAHSTHCNLIYSTQCCLVQLSSNYQGNYDCNQLVQRQWQDSKSERMLQWLGQLHTWISWGTLCMLKLGKLIECKQSVSGIADGPLRASCCSAKFRTRPTA